MIAQMTIEEVWEHYKPRLLEAEGKIGEVFSTVEPIISSIGKHLFMGGGKRIRPFLVILSSGILGYNGDKTSTLACSIECVHTASLLHDDVVDGADLRRGKPSANSLWGNQIVILVGDFLFSSALNLANSLKNQRLMDILSTATIRMTRGELQQLIRKGDPDISEEDYMKIITNKTAFLMSAACRGGAIIGNATQEKEDALSNFGLKLGLSFQIADDILDYMAEEKVFGKSLGKDLQEGKMTLPLIYLLKDASNAEAEKVKSIIKNESFSRPDLIYIFELLNKYNSIKQSYEKAGSILQEAKEELNIFQDSIEKLALLALSDYVLSREK